MARQRKDLHQEHPNFPPFHRTNHPPSPYLPSAPHIPSPTREHQARPRNSVSFEDLEHRMFKICLCWLQYTSHLSFRYANGNMCRSVPLPSACIALGSVTRISLMLVQALLRSTLLMLTTGRKVLLEGPYHREYVTTAGWKCERWMERLQLTNTIILRRAWISTHRWLHHVPSTQGIDSNPLRSCAR